MVCPRAYGRAFSTFEFFKASVPLTVLFAFTICSSKSTNPSKHLVSAVFADVTIGQNWQCLVYNSSCICAMMPAVKITQIMAMLVFYLGIPQVVFNLFHRSELTIEVSLGLKFSKDLNIRRGDTLPVTLQLGL